MGMSVGLRQGKNEKALRYPLFIVYGYFSMCWGI